MSEISELLSEVRLEEIAANTDNGFAAISMAKELLQRRRAEARQAPHAEPAGEPIGYMRPEDVGTKGNFWVSMHRNAYYRAPIYQAPSVPDSVVEALTAAKDFIALEYADSGQEQYGEWLAPEARKVFGLICEAIASITETGGAK